MAILVKIHELDKIPSNWTNKDDLIEAAISQLKMMGKDGIQSFRGVHPF